MVKAKAKLPKCAIAIFGLAQAIDKLMRREYFQKWPLCFNPRGSGARLSPTWLP